MTDGAPRGSHIVFLKYRHTYLDERQVNVTIYITVADLPGVAGHGGQVMFLGHILIDLTVYISCFILRQNAPLSDLVLKQSQQFQLPKHRFKLRQTASLSDLGLKGFSAVPTSENIESLPLVCNI